VGGVVVRAVPLEAVPQLLRLAVDRGDQALLHVVLPRPQGDDLLPQVAELVHEADRLLPDELQLRLVKLDLPLLERLDLPVPLSLACRLLASEDAATLEADAAA